MRFVTFNLWHGLSPKNPVLYEALEPPERLRLREARQTEVLTQLDADVCCFQECNPAARRAPQLARAIDSKFITQPDLVGLKLFGLGVPFNLNNALVTTARPRLGLREVDAISLTRPNLNLVRRWGSWQLREERFALFGEIVCPGGNKILVINTHVHHGLEATPEIKAEIEALGVELGLSESVMTELRERLGRGNARRQIEIGHLLARLDQLRGDYAAVVLAGDFNVAPGGEVGAQLRGYGFRDAWSEANPEDPGYTFDKSRNAANHILQASFPLTLKVEDLSFSPRVREALLDLARRQETKPRRIDHVWVLDQRVKTVARTAALFGFPDADGLAPSDHFGIVVDLEFQ